jgi:hypothetical protein
MRGEKDVTVRPNESRAFVESLKQQQRSLIVIKVQFCGTLTQVVIAIAATASTGCAVDHHAEGRSASNGLSVSMVSLGLNGASFVEAVPEKYRSDVHRTDRPARAVSDGMRRASSGTATAEIDATGERVFFPMQREVRSFASRSELTEFVVEHFGADQKFYDSKTGALTGARGSYAQHGTSFFEDTRLGTRFRVTDPVLAYVAGVTGTVKVEGESICLDPDGDCSSERASYLEPEGVKTELPTHVNLCGTQNVCVQYHTFFNTTPFPFHYARHGSNVRFTSESALPSTQLVASGRFDVEPANNGFFQTFLMPTASNTGQNSVETAVWCTGSGPAECGVVYQAKAACGSGTIFDQDLNGTRKTGNGPANTTRCF